MLLGLSLFLFPAAWAVGQSADGSGVLITRTISTAFVLPDSQFKVTLHLETDRDLSGVGIEETLPLGWTIHPLDNAGAVFKRVQGQWVFKRKIKASDKIDIVYEVTVPKADQLRAGPLPVCLPISGTFQSKTPALQIPITGDSKIQVVSNLPAMSAIAHLVPADKSRPRDTIDLRLGQKISRTQFTRAIELWESDIPVPGTGGETLDLPLIERIFAHYETCTSVDVPLPLTYEPKLKAVRTITTFLPDDTLLLPRGCLDPGSDARRFLVTVEITAQYDAYGVGVQEWLPGGWRAIQVKGDEFFYRGSHTEWFYPKRLAAGKSVKLVYQVEAAPAPPASPDCQDGCCGEDVKLVGTVSSALGCGKYDVTGEDMVHLWQCLPVILAISRWDVADDRLNVTLSDNISFPQVQRAVAFWQQSEAVPYTCGYTVGYETLKAIVAHWLNDIPVTKELATASRGPTAPGKAQDDSYEWLCQMKERQPASDWVGESTVPAVVDAGPDQVLTCTAPEAALRATVSGGVPPYSFIWKDPTGKIIGTTQEITVDRPGIYTVRVESCQGNAGSDSVTVTQDITPPAVDAGPDKFLTCASRKAYLRATIRDGRPPYTICWTDARGEELGTTEEITVELPGLYTVTVTGANGCTASDTVKVIEAIAPPQVDAGPDKFLTDDIDEVTLDATVTGGTPPYRYEWTNSSGTTIGDTEDIAVSTADTYTLTVTGADGCAASDSVVVTKE